MAKALQVFTGTDSYGRPQEYAQREDGVWFDREYGWNGHGMGFTRWARSHRQDLAAMIHDDELRYGFKPLRRGTPTRLRLPG